MHNFSFIFMYVSFNDAEFYHFYYFFFYQSRIVCEAIWTQRSIWKQRCFLTLHCTEWWWHVSWALGLPVHRRTTHDGRIWAEIISQIPTKSQVTAIADSPILCCCSFCCSSSSAQHNFEKFTWAFLAPNPSVADWSLEGLEETRLILHIKKSLHIKHEDQIGPKNVNF